jgi:hypothetical protein
MLQIILDHIKRSIDPRVKINPHPLERRYQDADGYNDDGNDFDDYLEGMSNIDSDSKGFIQLDSQQIEMCFYGLKEKSFHNPIIADFFRFLLKQLKNVEKIDTKNLVSILYGGISICPGVFLILAVLVSPSNPTKRLPFSYPNSQLPL